jgi:FMN phosphatase YigB (HAD superfamily)
MKKNNTNKVIIIDFMRTIYNPDTDSLFDGVLELLKKLYEEYELYLISRDEGQRQDIVKKLDVVHYFQKILFVKEKNLETFKTITENYHEVYIVGDYAKDEIDIGNELGAKTIWISHGKYKDIQPKKEPWRKIENFKQLEKILI